MLTRTHMGTLTCSHERLHMHTLVHTPRSTNMLTHTVNACTHMHACPCLHVHTQAHTHTCSHSQAHRDTCTRKNTLNSVSKPTGWLLCCLLPARLEAQLREAASSCPSACLRLPIALPGFTRPLHLLDRGAADRGTGQQGWGRCVVGTSSPERQGDAGTWPPPEAHGTTRVCTPPPGPHHAAATRQV